MLFNYFFKKININFIIKLLLSLKNDNRIYDVIFVIVNRYTKLILFRIIIKNFIITKLIRLVYKNIKYRFKTFINIINNYNKLLINKFLKKIIQKLGD